MDARETIIKKLSDTARDVGEPSFLEKAAGSLDEQIHAEPYELRDSFSDEDVDELFEDTP